MNEVRLIGTLVSSVAIRRRRGVTATFGRAVIAVTRAGGYGIDFIPVRLRRREALDAANYLDEGSEVSIIGRLHSVKTPALSGPAVLRRWWRLYVVADRVMYVRIYPPGGRGRP